MRNNQHLNQYLNQYLFVYLFVSRLQINYHGPYCNIAALDRTMLCPGH